MKFVLIWTQITKFMGPTWGPSGADRTQTGLMLAPCALLSGEHHGYMSFCIWQKIERLSGCISLNKLFQPTGCVVCLSRLQPYILAHRVVRPVGKRINKQWDVLSSELVCNLEGLRSQSNVVWLFVRPAEVAVQIRTSYVNISMLFCVS